MAYEEGTVETQEEKIKKMEKIKKKEAEKDLKPKLGEIRPLKAKSKSKKN
jgi:hypothetical protein